MGARVVKLICAHCGKSFKGEHKQARQPKAHCSYECDRWTRYKANRERIVINWSQMPWWTRQRAGRWLTA